MTKIKKSPKAPSFHERWKRVYAVFNEFLEKYEKQFSPQMRDEFLEVRNFMGNQYTLLRGEMLIFTKDKSNIKLPDDRGSFKKKFFIPRKPCEICGFDRAHNLAHIIPSYKGGALKEENMFNLCPNHHYLFDNYELTKSEWDKLDFSKKNEASKKYAKDVILQGHKNYWERKFL